MAEPAFSATRFVRSVSLTIALYLSVIAISSMTMVKPVLLPALSLALQLMLVCVGPRLVH